MWSTYVGKTLQVLGEKIKQHIPEKVLVNSRGKAVYAAADSTITKHLQDSSDCLHIQVRLSFTILAGARHSQHLEVLEALFIESKSLELSHQKKYVHVLTLIRSCPVLIGVLL